MKKSFLIYFQTKLKNKKTKIEKQNKKQKNNATTCAGSQVRNMKAAEGSFMFKFFIYFTVS